MCAGAISARLSPTRRPACCRRRRCPAGYWVAWGGQFDNLQAAARRLQIVVPASLALVLVLLFMMFNNVKDGLLVFTGIPFALSGGHRCTVGARHPMSISAAVGFIALSGVAVLNGLVMIAFIRSLREQGMPLAEAVRTARCHACVRS